MRPSGSDIVNNLTFGHVDGCREFNLGMMNVCAVSKDSRTVLEILDGQQRLDTLCLILAAIRKKLLDHGKEEETEYANGISERLWQRADKCEDLREQPRLELKWFDVGFFNNILKEPSAMESIKGPSSPHSITQKNIRANLQAIKVRLEDCSTQECIAVMKYILNSTYMVVAKYTDTQAALQVYRTGNMTEGLKLAPMDLLKAEVLEHVELKEQEAISNSWEELERQLGRQEMAELFKYLIIIYLEKRHSPNTEMDDLNKMFQAAWRRRHSSVSLGCATDTKAGVWFTNGFLPRYLRAFAELAENKLPGTSNRHEVKSEFEYFLKVLHRLPGQRVCDGWMPAALVLAAECSGCDSALILGVLSRLERLAWFLLLSGADINAIHERFCRVTASLREQGADSS
ncbi:g5844 [Coccomyxa elongata]